MEELAFLKQGNRRLLQQISDVNTRKKNAAQELFELEQDLVADGSTSPSLIERLHTIRTKLCVRERQERVYGTK